MSEKERIGIYGGTFDPVHIGHLACAEQAMGEAGLDRIIFLPAGDPPHKGEEVTSSHHRVRMLELAVEGNDRFSIDMREVLSSEVSYTVHTLDTFFRDYPEADLYFIIGEDSLASIRKWYRWEEILSKIKMLVVRRPDSGIDCEEMAKELNDEGYHIRILGRYALDISSSKLRESVASEESIRYLVPDAVREYIQREGLYVRA